MRMPYIVQGTTVPSNERVSRETDLWSFLCGANALMYPDQSIEDHPPAAHNPSPEDNAAFALAFERLFDDAKYVARLVLDTPAEAVTFLYTPTRQQITRWRIFRYLCEFLNWDRPSAKQAIRDLELFVRELDSV